MEQLENVYFPRVSQYRFCQLMIENLPKLREDIKEISMSDLKDFLESIRKHSDKIGETAMKQVSLKKENFNLMLFNNLGSRTYPEFTFPYVKCLFLFYTFLIFPDSCLEWISAAFSFSLQLFPRSQSNLTHQLISWQSSTCMW